MIITTQDNLADYDIIETLGLVKGNVVRARHVGRDLMAAFRNVVGGEINEYTKLVAESREQAIDRMITNAETLGADGIVCMRLTTSSIAEGASELLAFGTAVRLQKK